MDVVSVPLADLHADPANARLHDQKNIAAISGSLLEFKQYQPLVVQKSTMKVVVGNGRFEAMKRLKEEGKWGDVADCVVLDLDDMRATMLAVADNRTAELGAWNEEALRKILQEVEGAFDISAFGFSLQEALDPTDPVAAAEAETVFEQSIQMAPEQQYIVILAKTEEEWEKLRAALELKTVRRGGYKKGSTFDTTGVQRVVPAADLLKRLEKGPAA